MIFCALYLQKLTELSWRHDPDISNWVSRLTGEPWNLNGKGDQGPQFYKRGGGGGEQKKASMFQDVLPVCKVSKISAR